MSAASDLSPDQSQALIYSTLRSYGLPDQFSKLVTAQSGHETDGWTSNVYLSDNNAFGYGYTGSSYTSYDSVEASVNDMVGYISRRLESGQFPDLGTIVDADQWAQLLASVGYYTDNESNYAAGIARWFNNNLTLTAGVSLLLLIFVAGFLLLKK